MFCPRATSVSRELQARLVQVWRTFWEQKPDTAVGRDQKAGLGLVGVVEHQCGALLWPKSLCRGPAAPVKWWKWPVESQTSSQLVPSPLDEGWGWTRKTTRLKVIFSFIYLFIFLWFLYTCEALTWHTHIPCCLLGGCLSHKESEVEVFSLPLLDTTWFLCLAIIYRIRFFAWKAGTVWRYECWPSMP